MAIITKPPANVARKAVTIRMPQVIVDTLHQYASFIGSGLDHVVVEALKLVFRKDAEFKVWQNQRPDHPSHAFAGGGSAESTSAMASPPFDEPKHKGRRSGAMKDEEA